MTPRYYQPPSILWVIIFSFSLHSCLNYIVFYFTILANLTQSQQGVLLLEQNYSTAMKDVFENYSSYLRNLPTDLKNRAFSSLEHIFSFETSVTTDVR